MNISGPAAVAKPEMLFYAPGDLTVTARRLVGPNYRVLLGTTVLTGGVLMVFSDIISRTLLSPNEIPIGIVAAVIGAPYFLYLLVKS